MKPIKLITIIMCLKIIILSTITSLAADNIFSDVTPNDYYYNAINQLYQLKIIDGFDDDFFRPDEKITRAQMTKIIINAKKLADEAKNNTSILFKDVTHSKNSWAIGYVATAKLHGIIDGTSPDTFNPNTAITYAQAAKMLVNACGYNDSATEQGGWPFGYIQCSDKLGLNRSLESIEDNAYISRGQAAIMVANAIKVPLFDASSDVSKSLLNESFSVYEAYGYATQSDKSITFAIKQSDNFDGKKINCIDDISDNSHTVACSNPNDCAIYDYTYALIRKDNVDNFSIIYTEQAQPNKTAIKGEAASFAMVDRFFLSEGRVKVRLITVDGVTKDFMLNNDNRKELGLDYLKDGDVTSLQSLGLTSYKSLSRFVKYSINSSNEVFLEKLPDDYLEICESQLFSNNKIGTVPISDSMFILDASVYAADCNAITTPISKSTFADNSEYTVVFAGKDQENNTYSMAIVLSGMANGFALETGMVIAQNGFYSTQGETNKLLYCVDALSNSGEIRLYAKNSDVFSDIKEGTVFIFAANNNMVDNIKIIAQSDECAGNFDRMFSFTIGKAHTESDNNYMDNIYFIGKDYNKDLRFILAPIYNCSSSSITLGMNLNTVLDCPKIEHTYTSSCGPLGQHINCGMEEHVHNDKCPHKQNVSEQLNEFIIGDSATVFCYDYTVDKGNRVYSLPISDVASSTIDKDSELGSGKMWFGNPKNIVNYAIVRIYDNKVQEIVFIKTKK